MNPLTSPSLGNAAQPLMQDSTASAAQSSDTPASGRPHASNGYLLFARGTCAGALGTITVLATNAVSSKLNQPAEEFLYDHCLSNMTYAQFREYAELDPFVPNLLADLAITTTALFIASGGLTPLYNAGKSISRL